MDKQQLNPRNLLPKERLNIIKHYTGSKTKIVTGSKFECLDEGVIEEINIEEQHIVVKNEGVYMYVKPENLLPRLRKLSEITQEDIDIILDLIVVDNVCPEKEGFYIEKKEETFIKLARDQSDKCDKIVIFIKSNWSINVVKGDSSVGEINNYPEVIFRLCDLGFDLTNHF